MRNDMIQIKMGARQPPKEFALGWTLLGWSTALTNRHRFSARSSIRNTEAAADTSRCKRGSRKARSDSGRHATDHRAASGNLLRRT